MVVAVSVVTSSMVESHASPCLCVDALPTTSVKITSGGDVVTFKNFIRRKHLIRRRTMELNSSFIDAGKDWRVFVSRSYKKQCRDKRVAIVNELGGQYDDTFDDVKTQMLNYFTYKAVRTVLQQLYEMNPPQYTWFYNFVASNKPADGKRFLRTLGKEQQHLAERVMVTRLHLYGKWVKKCNHAEIYQEITDENLELMRERLMETVIWPLDETK
ncbi:PREDICTED: chaperonin-like RbcX protein 2, chloroplastic [Lupinus angustifolius]|uniref:chaperonin-like RbcX protein 2, chloroplastic n=1 Tax=Lupinus angustifolius TaxID=3871 RepID=UPI00092F54FF|nr:PREDICTED: chaperonin-like RbcX protein 2, chloroplastic [Lupinus angustifolius]